MTSLFLPTTDMSFDDVNSVQHSLDIVTDMLTLHLHMWISRAFNEHASSLGSDTSIADANQQSE